VDGKTLSIKLNPPFNVVADRTGVRGGGPFRDTSRTLKAAFQSLLEHFKNAATPKNAEGSLPILP
jgi:hypothetical protein